MEGWTKGDKWITVLVVSKRGLLREYVVGWAGLVSAGLDPDDLMLYLGKAFTK